ncbi:MAG: hypothetical protein OXG46_04090 [Chloroflexi bacterium]|nr:hypothetical protein [Chloroflexota bacterium]MCY3938658.1 hypothetical protein [Chloroflexota bacterium]
MLHFRKNTPEREEWWAISDQTGEVFGPFDPGTVWFETPPQVRGGDLLRLQRVADLILNEAHASWERLQRALAFMQPNGSAVYRRFMESGILPTQTPALGLAGGLDIPAYFGDGESAGTAGLHFDDSHNGTTITGFNGGAGVSADQHSARSGRAGSGPGRGLPGGPDFSRSGCGGSGGGYGTEGGNGLAGGNNSIPGGVTVPAILALEAMRRNSYTRDILGFGSGGGGGGTSEKHQAQSSITAGSGGQGGSAFISVVHGVLSTTTRSLAGSDGGSATIPSGVTHSGGGGGGGAGGLWLGMANKVIYGTGAIDVSGGRSGSGSSSRNGGAGGDGRVVQVYFDSKADNLQVTNGVQSQFRILRSVPIGQNTFL